jgi:hypothetical protein
MAHQEAVHVGNSAALTAHTGTAGTAEMVRVVATSAGALSTQSTGDWASYSGTIVIPTSDTVQVGTLVSTVNGRTHGITVQTPDMEGTDTTTVRLIDGLGGTVIGLAAQAESAITYYGTVQPITTSMRWTATAQGTQSAAGTIKFQLHYEK